MSLVAYDDSDVSDNEDSHEGSKVCDIKAVLTQPPLKNVEKDKNIYKNSGISESGTSQISDEEEDTKFTNEISSTFSSLPAPTSKFHDIDIDWRKLSKGLTGKSSTVKITVPSLSEIEKESSEEPVKKKLKPSKKGCGLFALLPNPKNSFINQMKTVRPQKTAASVVLKPEVKKVGLKQMNKVNLSVDYDSPDETENDTDKQLDFFSLNSSDIPADVTVPEVNVEATQFSILDQSQEKPSINAKEITFDITENKTFNPVPLEEPAMSSASSSSYIPLNDDDPLQLDEQALQQLCGRKERQKSCGGLELIDVSGDAILPDAREWMTKQLTEEQNTVLQSHKKKNGPTVQQKRKHQITYLAFQAKEHELELKNQWSNNRMSRKQTQAKYGF